MDDLSRIRIKQLLERGFAKTEASLDQIEGKIVEGVEITRDFVHALRRRDGKHLRLVEGESASNQGEK